MQLINRLFLLLFLLSGNILFSQVKVGEWLDHLSYDYTNSVAKVGNKVYVSNGSGLETYDENDNRVEKLTKINGLSDVGVKLLRTNDNNDRLMVVYSNTNIDIIKPSGEIINISDIKRKIITGNKVINEVYFSGKMAYIACGFGVIAFDTDKLEIKDTYYLGTATLNLEVYQITKNDTAFFAATTDGVYYGKVNDNLSYFQNWKPLNTGIAVGPYNAIVNYNGKIITNYSEMLKSGGNQLDTLYEYTTTGWVKYSSNMNYTHAENRKLYDYSKYNKLLILDQFGLGEFATNGQRTNYIANYGSPSDPANINDACYDNSHFWLADAKNGLVKSTGGFGTNERLPINGPTNNLVNDFDLVDGTLVVAPIYLGNTFANQYLYKKPNIYKDQEWTSFPSSGLDTIRDINCVVIDPNDKTHVVFGCMDHGITELKNGQFFNYNSSTPSLSVSGQYYGAFVTAVSFDKDGNIWAGLTLGKKSLNVLKAGTSNWVGLDIEQFAFQPTVYKMVFDKYDQAWVILARNGGLMVYKGVSSLPQPNTSNTKLLSNAVGNGHLPSIDVQSICEDKEGHIWVGTSKGITVFYNPENVFTNANWDAQQILIEQDGHVQILLENDAITAITVDGVNRKWVGTESSGVYCFSADGQKQIYHFAAADSPLYSDHIKDITTDETTGDVFIATDKGIQSYRTSIIKGFEEYTKVHAFPNPIKPGYSGVVSITGLIDESDVKITDVYGNLVWSTKSQGGMVEWNLQTFRGVKAATGTYMIYCASSDGEKYATAKLLIVN